MQKKFSPFFIATPWLLINAVSLFFFGKVVAIIVNLIIMLVILPIQLVYNMYCRSKSEGVLCQHNSLEKNL